MAMPINTPTTVAGNTVTLTDTDGDLKADQATIQKADGTAVVVDGIDDDTAKLQELRTTLTSLGFDADNILGGNDSTVNQLASGQKTELGNISTDVSNHINHMLRNPQANTNDSALQSRWSEFMGKAASNDFVDVNALVQYVLRESYLSTTDDLKFYATKVKFFNNMKKELRDQTTEMREKLAKYAGQPDDYVLNPPETATIPDQNFYGVDTNGNARTSETASGVSQLSGGGLQEAPTPTDPYTSAVMTEGGYLIETNVPDGNKVRITGPDGEEMFYAHGDPHVRLGGSESDDFHFGEDSTIILPDGSKVTLDTVQNDNEEWYTKGITVCSGSDAFQVGQLGGDAAGEGTTVEAPGSMMEGERLSVDAAVADASTDASAGVLMLVGSGDDVSALKFNSTDGQFYEVEDRSWEDYKEDHTLSTSADASTAALSAEQRAALADGGGLQALVGADKVYTTKAELEAGIKDFETMLSTAGDDAQLANLDLQNVLQKQQQTLQLMSNISKMLNDTAMSIIRKIGG